MDAGGVTSVAYCGFRDRQNLGDFALFRANERLFPDFKLLDGRAPEAAAGLFGGGTMFPYSLRYGTYPRRRVNFAIGLGVSDPEFDGPYGPLTRLAMRRWRFPYFGVRGHRSQHILQQHGIRSTVTGDTALAWTRPPGVETQSDLIALCLVGESMRRVGASSDVAAAVERAARELAAEGKRFLCVPFCEPDRPLMRSICTSLGDAAEMLDFWDEPVAGDLTELLRRLARCELMLGERLHSLVLAAAVGVPFVGLGYKPKCHDFVETLGLSNVMLNPAAIDAARVRTSMKAVLADRTSILEQSADRVQYLRAQLNAAADEIRELARSARLS